MNAKCPPPSIHELKTLRHPVRNVNREHEESLSPLERFATLVTEHVGSMGFFLLILAWTAIWLTWNALGPRGLRFDPFPAFVLWLFISNMIQILLMPLIMIGQNLQSRHTEKRADSDYEVNLRAEREIEAILLRLDCQDEKIERVLAALAKEAKN